jgi:hypothetical protein
MALRIISAEERLAESRGIKAAIFGGSGQGKTSLLWTLPADRTIFMDLEAGDLAVEGWTGDTIRPRTWQECRDFAAFIGGPNPMDSAWRRWPARFPRTHRAERGRDSDRQPCPCRTGTFRVARAHAGRLLQPGQGEAGTAARDRRSA